jgi:predicted phage-related endonuclease
MNIPIKRLADSAHRRHFIVGSDARIIMGQDEKALIRLRQEKRGEVGPEDLSANLIVQVGVVTEDLNRVWYERNAVQSGLTCRFFEETWRGSRSFGDAPPASHR